MRQVVIGALVAVGLMLSGAGTLSAADSDVDGIDDAQDACPGTGVQRPVTSNGCSESQLGLTRPTECAQGNSAYARLIVGSGNIVGPSGSNNLIYGSNSSDNLVDYGFNSCLVGRGGNDNLSGGVGVDVLVGGSGTDRGVGGSGFDFCYVEVKSQCES